MPRQIVFVALTAREASLCHGALIDERWPFNPPMSRGRYPIVTPGNYHRQLRGLHNPIIVWCNKRRMHDQLTGIKDRQPNEQGIDKWYEILNLIAMTRPAAYKYVEL